MNNGNEPNNIEQIVLRPFTLPELAPYDGKDGMPAYVSVNGVVYDFTNSNLWRDGEHFGSIAGRELTIDYQSCHRGRPRLEAYPIVGYIVPVEQKPD